MASRTRRSKELRPRAVGERDIVRLLRRHPQHRHVELEPNGPTPTTSQQPGQRLRLVARRLDEVDAELKASVTEARGISAFGKLISKPVCAMTWRALEYARDINPGSPPECGVRAEFPA